jgi:hypothetical protein
MIRNAVRRRSNAATRCGLDRSLRPLATLLILLLAACSTPIGAWQAGSQSTSRTLTANLLSTGKLSAFSQNVLRLHALSATDDDEALAAPKALHGAAAAADFPAAELFALSELAVQHAERRDPLIRNRLQFWFFGYESGNLIPYSAMPFRDAPCEAMQKLDPIGMDPALRQAVVIGHSEGGLLAKMAAIDSGATTLAANSIIAVKGDGPVESGSDGVVKYASAHIEEAQSEYVVRSGRSCQADPRTIAEVRRILLLHPQETCARDHVACAPRPRSSI